MGDVIEWALAIAGAVVVGLALRRLLIRDDQ